jgi:hypothetical protein
MCYLILNYSLLSSMICGQLVAHRTVLIFFLFSVDIFNQISSSGFIYMLFTWLGGENCVYWFVRKICISCLALVSFYLLQRVENVGSLQNIEISRLSPCLWHSPLLLSGILFSAAELHFSIYFPLFSPFYSFAPFRYLSLGPDISCSSLARLFVWVGEVEA